MKIPLFQSAAWQIMMNVDFVSKLILLSLFMLSVVCVAIIIFKYIHINRDKKNLEQILKRIKQARGLNDVIMLGKEFHGTAGGRFLHSNLTDLKHILDSRGKESAQQTLESKDMEQLGTVVSQAVDSVLMEQESYLPVLSSSAGVGPLVGLFGTIWGLIHAFIDIAQEHSADIATVAPGMAEALTTTLAGLIVAIPAMLAYHYFAQELRRIEFLLVQIADRFLYIATTTLLK